MGMGMGWSGSDLQILSIGPDLSVGFTVHMKGGEVWEASQKLLQVEGVHHHIHGNALPYNTLVSNRSLGQSWKS